MSLIAAGLSHRTARVEEREPFALSSAELPEAVQHFARTFGNGVILSTCNRTEIYVHPHHAEIEPANLLIELASFKGRGRDIDLPGYYGLRGREVPTHLFRVAAGVDSMILGESQILGQVRSALTGARDAHTLDAALARLLHDALRTGRRARHETDIARHAVSVSSAAVALVRRHVPDFHECRALVVGAGEAGKLAARALRDHGVDQITVTSRTLSRAEDLADFLGGSVVDFSELESALAAADLVITSSSADDYLIDADLVARSRGSVETPVVFMDVAVPRDVDPAVNELPGIHVFDIDDLQTVAESNLERRESATADVFRLVEQATDTYEDWLDQRHAVPTIKALVRHADAIRREELERTLNELQINDTDREKLDRMTAAIVKKLLHEPIDFLRQADDTEDGAQTVRDIFGVEDD